jgi:hypothetical protein
MKSVVTRLGGSHEWVEDEMEEGGSQKVLQKKI